MKVKTLNLLKAAQLALDTYENITTLEFELGYDKPARKALKKAIEKFDA